MVKRLRRAAFCSAPQAFKGEELNWLEAILLGLVQGLTEFLPVSSSGHLAIAQELLGVVDSPLFTVAIHGATLVAVVFFYRLRIIKLAIDGLRRDPAALRYIAKLILATLPAVIATLIAEEKIKSTLGNHVVASWCLLVTGALLWTTRVTLGRGQSIEPTWRGALIIGCAQAFALLPGISRSGTTIVAALFVGMAPIAAAEFSFLMAVIAICGAVVLEIPDLQHVSPAFVMPIALGCIAALLSGLAALWLFVRLLRDQRFYRFSYYVWTLGAVVLIWQYFLR